MLFCIKNPEKKFIFKWNQDEARIVQSKEGPVNCATYAFEIKGVQGELWVNDFDKFCKNYIPIFWEVNENGELECIAIANPDSEVKEFDPNIEGKSGILEKEWGTAEEPIVKVDYSEKDVLINEMKDGKPVIKNGEIEQYPCKKDIFEETYKTGETKEELTMWFDQKIEKIKREKNIIKDWKELKEEFGKFIERIKEENYKANRKRLDTLDSGIGSFSETSPINQATEQEKEKKAYFL